MLGRVRPPPSSLDCLELERPASSKLIKDEALSLYEATLQKLRLGSRRARFPPSTEAMQIDAPCSSATSSPSFSGGQCQSIISSNQVAENSCGSPPF